ANARISQMRVSAEGVRETSEISDALHVARELSDPDVRSSFLVSYGYLKGLHASYDEMLPIAQELLNDGETFQLNYVKPHAHWQIAFASLGLRRFGDAERAVRRADACAPAGDEFQTLNNRTLRARLNLAQNHLTAARETVACDVCELPQREMLDE